MLKKIKKVKWLPSITEPTTNEVVEWKASFNFIPITNAEFYVELSNKEGYKYHLFKYYINDEFTESICYSNDFSEFDKVKGIESVAEVLGSGNLKALLVKEPTMSNWTYGVVMYDDGLFDPKIIQNDINHYIEAFEKDGVEWNIDDLKEKFNNSIYHDGCEFFSLSENDSVFA